MGVSDVVQTVEKFARATPKEVTPVGAGAFLIRFDNVAHVKKMVKIDGTKIAGTDKKTVVKQTDLHLPTEEIFRLVESKLLLREKSEAFQTAKDFGGANSNRQSRSEKKEKRIEKVEAQQSQSPSPHRGMMHGEGKGAGGGACLSAPPVLVGSPQQTSTMTGGGQQPPTQGPPASAPSGQAWGGPQTGFVPSWQKGGGGGGFGKGSGYASYPPQSQPWWNGKGYKGKGKGQWVWQSQNYPQNGSNANQPTNVQWTTPNASPNPQNPTPAHMVSSESPTGGAKWNGKGKGDGKGRGGRGKGDA